MNGPPVGKIVNLDPHTVSSILDIEIYFCLKKKKIAQYLSSPVQFAVSNAVLIPKSIKNARVFEQGKHPDDSRPRSPDPPRPLVSLKTRQKENSEDDNHTNTDR